MSANCPASIPETLGTLSAEKKADSKLIKVPPNATRKPSAAYDVQGMGQWRAVDADQTPKRRLQFRHHPDCGADPNRAEENHGNRCHVAWREQAEANEDDNEP